MGVWSKSAISAHTRFHANKLHRNRAKAERLLGKPVGRSTHIADPVALHFEALEPRMLLAADLWHVGGGATVTDYLDEVDQLFGDNIAAQLEAAAAEVDGLADDLIDALNVNDLLDTEIPGLLTADFNDGMFFDTVVDGSTRAVTIGDVLDINDFLADLGGGATFEDLIADQVTDIIGNLAGDAGTEQPADINGDTLAATIESALESISLGGLLNPSSFTIDADVAYRFVDIADDGDPGNDVEYLFDVEIDITRSETFTFDFGRNADLFGVKYFGNDFDAIIPDDINAFGLPQVAIDALLEIDFTVGVEAGLTTELRQVGEISDGMGGTIPVLEDNVVIDPQVAFIENVEARAGVSADVDQSISLGLDFGIIEITGNNLTFDLSATINATVDGGPDGRLTIGGGAPSLLTTQTGNMSASMEISIDDTTGASGFLADSGFLSPGEAFSIDLSATNIFSGAYESLSGSDDPRTAPEISFTNFEDLLPFLNIDLMSLANVFDDLGTFLSGFEGLSLTEDAQDVLFGAAIPFVDGLTISDLLDLGSGLDRLVSDVMLTEIDDLLVPEYESLQDFAEMLAGFLNSTFDYGGTPLEIADIAPTFDIGESRLSFTVVFDETFELLDTDDDAPDFEFATDLGPIGNISASGSFGFTTDMALSFVIGIDLDGGADSATAQKPELLTAFAPYALTSSVVTGTAVQDGNLTEDTQFRLVFGSGQSVLVTLDGINYGNTSALASALEAAIVQGIEDFNPDVDPVTLEPLLDPTDADYIDLDALGLFVDVSTIDGTDRIKIVAPGASSMTILEATIFDDDDNVLPNGFDQLGFADGQDATSSTLPVDGVLSADAVFELNVDGDSQTVTVDHDAGGDLIDLINAGIDAAYGGSSRVQAFEDVSGGDSFLVIRAVDPEGDPVELLRVDVDGSVGGQVAAQELGLVDGQISSTLILAGERDVTISVNTSGNAANAIGAGTIMVDPPAMDPADATIDQTITVSLASAFDPDLTGDYSVDIDLSEAFGRFVTETGNPAFETAVNALDAADKASALARAINDALDRVPVGGFTLGNLVRVLIDDFRDGDGNPTGDLGLRFVADSALIDSLTIDAFPDGWGYDTATDPSSTIVGAPSDGTIGNATFRLEVVGPTGGIDGYDINLAAGTYGSIDAIADAINAQLGLSTVFAGVIDGRIAFGATDATGIAGLRVVNTNAAATSDLGFGTDSTSGRYGEPRAFIAQNGSDPFFTASASVEGEGSASLDFGLVGLSAGVAAGADVSVTFNPWATTSNGQIVLFEDLFAGLSQTSLLNDSIGLAVGGAVDDAVLDVVASAEVTFSGVEVTGWDLPDASQFLVDLQNELTDFGNNLLPTVTLNVPDFLPSFDGDVLNPPDLAALFDGFDFLPSLDGLSYLSDLSADDILFVLRAAADALLELAEWDFLDQPIPVIDLRLGEALGFIEDFETFVSEMEEAGIDQIQQLEDLLNDALGTFDGLGVALSYVTNSPGALGIELDFARAFSRVLPLDLDLVALFNEIPGLTLPDILGDIVNLSGSANLAADFGFAAGLDVVVDVQDIAAALAVGDIAGALAEIEFGANLDVTAYAGAENASFVGAIGPFGFFINNAGAVLNSDGVLGNATPASASLSLAQGSIANLLDGIDFGTDVNILGSFGAGAQLPIFFPTEDTYLGTIDFTVTLPDLTDFSTLDYTANNTTAFPDFSSPDILALFDDIGLVDGIRLVIEGVDVLLDTLGDLVSGEMFGIEDIGRLPFVGDALEDISGVFDDLRNEVIQPLLQLIEDAEDFAADILDNVRDILEDAFATLDAFGNTAVQIVLSDADGLIGSFDQAAWDAASDIEALVAGATEFYFDLSFEINESVQANDVDFGLPLFGLEIDDPIEVIFEAVLNLGLGFNLDDGIFVDLFGDSVPELGAALSVILPDEIVGRLGFLELTATRNDPAVNPAEEVPNLFGFFQVDIDDGDALDGDNRLTFGDIPNMEFDVAFGAAAQVNYGLSLGINDSGPDSPFPSLVVDEFGLNWGFTEFLGADPGDLLETLVGSDYGDTLASMMGAENLSGITVADLENAFPLAPDLVFGNIGLDIGSFLTNVITPIVEKVQEYIGPIQPVLDVVTEPIPVISDLLGPTSLLDIAALTGYLNPALVDAIEILAEITGTINDLDVDGGDNIVLYFGSLDFGSLNDGMGTALDFSDPSQASALFDPGTAIDSALSALGINNSFLDTFVSEALAVGTALLEGSGDLAGSGLGDASSLLGSEVNGEPPLFSFPFLNDPTQVFGLLFGRDMTMVLLDVPPLIFGFDYDVFVPIWGPLGVTFGGGITLEIDLAFGYDTFGIRKFAEGDFRNPLDLFQGFFIADDQPALSGVDGPELLLKGEITATATLNAVVASAGVGGGIFVEIGFDLNDPNGDLKIRFDELYANIINGFEELGPLGLICIFDVSGEITARMFAYVELLGGLFEKRWYFGPEAPLLEFSYSCPKDPILATDVGGGTLRLNIGDFAADRVYGSLLDTDEKFVVTDDGSTTTIQAWYAGEMHTQTIDGVFSRIEGYAGQGNDIIDISGAQSVTESLLEGGVGNDWLSGGNNAADTILGEAGLDVIFGNGGADLVYGGLGADRIFGGDQDDKLFGEAGADIISGGAGADYIEGGLDNDTIDGEAGDDTILGNEGNDLITGGAGNDIIGSGEGDDIVFGDYSFDITPTTTTPAVGDTVVDTLESLIPGGVSGERPALGDMSYPGGPGNDIIALGAGSDWAQGDGGEDWIWGDYDILVDNNCNVLAETDAGDIGDFLSGIGDLDIAADFGIVASMNGLYDALGELPVLVLPGYQRSGNDTISGGAGDDLIYGNDGNDVLRGDLLDGGVDLLEGVDDANQANDGNDVIFGQRGADIAFGNAGNDHISGGSSGDFLFGNDDNDYIEAEQGVDVVFGDNGLITLFANGDATSDVARPYDAFTTDLKKLETTDPTVAGDDTIFGDQDNDYLFGGPGADQIEGGTGDDVAFGDNGEVEFEYDADLRRSFAVLIQSTDQTFGAGDTIEGQTGRDYLFGGDGGDVINGDLPTSTGGEDSRDIIFGDNGRLELEIQQTIRNSVAFYAVSNDLVGTDAALQSGDDTIVGGFQSDIIIAGPESDDVTGGEDDDIIIGDRGEIIWDLTSFEGLDDGTSGFLSQIDYLQLIKTVRSIDLDDDLLTGSDELSGGDAADILIGGGKGDLLYGDQELGGGFANGTTQAEDIILGDNGIVEFFDPPGQVFSTPALDADDQPIPNRFLIDSTPRAVHRVATTDTVEGTGGSDTAYGDGADDVIMGGVSGDGLFGSAGNDIVLGDNGEVLYALEEPVDGAAYSVRDEIRTIGYSVDIGGFGVFVPPLGGDDEISGGWGRDVLIGGSFADLILGDSEALPGYTAPPPTLGVDGNDVLIGDQGLLDYNPDILDDAGQSLLELVTTTDDVEGDGGSDVIDGNGGDDIAMGGTFGDAIQGSSGLDILLGDEGRVVYAGALSYGTKYDDNDPTTIDLIETFRSDDLAAAGGLGGVDYIFGEGNSDIAMGGRDGDFIYGDATVDVPFEQYTAAQFAAETADADFLDPAGLGDSDVLMGDGGRMEFHATNPVFLFSNQVSEGGSDRITGDDAGDIIIGGDKDDWIWGESQDLSLTNPNQGRGDIVLGDNGLLSWDGAPDPDSDLPAHPDDLADRVVGRDDVTGIIMPEQNLSSLDTLDIIMSIAPTEGGNDVIRGNAGGDILIGGTGSDLVEGDSWTQTGGSAGPDGLDGDDLIIGDHAIVFPTLGATAEKGSQFFNNFFFSKDTDAADLGAGDILLGNGAADIMIGGQGDDLMLGQTGDDDMIGGHNISGELGGAKGETAEDELDDLDAGSAAAIANELSLFDLGIEAALADAGFTLAALNPMDVVEYNDLMDGGADDDVMVGDNARIIRQDGNFFAYSPIQFGTTAQPAEATVAGDYGTLDIKSPRFRALGADEVLYLEVNDVPASMQGVLDGGGAPGLTLGFALNPALTDEADHLDMELVRDTTLFDHSYDVLADALANDDAVNALDWARPFGNDVMAGGTEDDEMWGSLGDDLMQGDGSLVLTSGPALGVTAIGTEIVPPLNNIGADQTVVAALIAVPGIDCDVAPVDNSVSFVVAENAGDGNDYMEGNAGNDRMYGGLGQDDMIGGSSTLFGLTDTDERMDGADLMYGGAANGALMARSADVADGGSIVNEATRHGEDADAMMGDNANLYRVVTQADGGEARTFNYDQVDLLTNPFGFDISGYGEAIIPRAFELVDYAYSYTDPSSLGAEDEVLTFAGVGAGDLMFGESGDDVMHGMTGDDVLFGNSEDDDLYGEHGADFLFGGTGIDGILGDDGLIMTSRNALATADLGGEPIYGLQGFAPDQTGTLRKNETADPNSLNAVIKTPGSIQQAIINVDGELIKSVILAAHRVDDLEAVGTDGLSTRFNDIIFGGLGTDFIHSGDGDDAVSGAEALPYFYFGDPDADTDADIDALNNPDTDGYYGDTVQTFTEVNAMLELMQQFEGFDPTLAPPPPDLQERPFWYNFAPVNPGNILNKGGGGKADEFAYYDEFNPRRKLNLALNQDGTQLIPQEELANSEVEFILNFDESEGPLDERFVDAMEGAGVFATDGDDRIFGDLGHDWIVGGTGRDNMYGGRGDDLINMDDDHDTDSRQFKPKPKQVPGDLNNNQPDPYQAYGDITYGGAGRDVMILNTGADRAMDWVGEFNSFIVPFSPFGAFHISRSLQPQTEVFLLELSDADGADQSMPDGQLYIEQKRADVRTDDPDGEFRNYEPFGELGMVRQEDRDWGEQTGAPNDPQPGNLQGKREVMRRELFTSEDTMAFAEEFGNWTLSQNQYHATPEFTGEEGISIFHLDEQIPGYVEILATVNIDKAKAGYKANGYIIFDYISPTDFKFAGIDSANDKIEIGHRTANGWTVDAFGNMQLKEGRDYELTLALHGSVATIYVDGGNAVSFVFGDPLQTGLLGLGVDNSRTSFDDYQVQTLPPVKTFEIEETFDANDGGYTAQRGVWSLNTGTMTASVDADGMAVATRHMVFEPFARLWLETSVDTDNAGGFVFDYYSPNEFKFVVLDAQSGQLKVGHVQGGKLTVDAFIDVTVGNGAQDLEIEIHGASVVITLNGFEVMSYAFNAILNDGAFGLIALDGEATFDSITVSGDDPAYDTGEAFTAATIGDGAAVLSQEDLDQAIAGYEARTGETVDATFLIADLDGATLGQTTGDGTVLIDADAAGHGWYIDETPLVDEDGEVVGMDLLSVIEHELEHLEGETHVDDGGSLEPVLSAGERVLDDPVGEDTSDSWMFVAADKVAPQAGDRPAIAWENRRDASSRGGKASNFHFALSQMNGVVNTDKYLNKQ